MYHSNAVIKKVAKSIKKKHDFAFSLASKRRNQESQQAVKLLKPEYEKTFYSQTRQEEKEAMGGRAEDRISYLPESILQSILTMMPLKSAIRTDVLSKKWRNLWKYSLSIATTMEFGEDFANNLSAKDFVETINRYLLMNDSKELESFHVFFCPFDLFASDIERWIRFATGKGVRYLHIDLSQGFRNPEDGEFTDERSPFELPSSLFDCDSLIELSLSRCSFITPLNLINFGGLQSLSISHSNFTEEMLQSILTECCLLESLSLSNCLKLVDIRIMVPNLKLKRLTIRDCLSAHLLEINAPKLQSFHYFGAYTEIYFLNISSLEDASIYSFNRESELDYSSLLSDISHVQILTLCTETLVCLNQNEEYDDDQLQIELQNLQELQLLMTSLTNEDLTFFYNFIYVCSFPHLEKLFIQLPRHIEDPNEERYGQWMMNLNPRRLVNFTFEHLKVIKVTNFKGSISEMRLVSFLLQKAAILETLVLVLPFVKEGNGKESLVLRVLRGQVLLLQKASPNAQIILHEFEQDDGFNPTHVEIYNDYSCLPDIPCLFAG